MCIQNKVLCRRKIGPYLVCILLNFRFVEIKVSGAIMGAWSTTMWQQFNYETRQGEHLCQVLECQRQSLGLPYTPARVQVVVQKHAGNAGPKHLF